MTGKDFITILLLFLGSHSRVRIRDSHTELSSSFDESFATSGTEVMGEISTVDTVVHQEDF